MTTATLEVRVTSARPVNYELYKQFVCFFFFVFFFAQYLIICSSAKAKSCPIASPNVNDIATFSATGIQIVERRKAAPLGNVNAQIGHEISCLSRYC